MGRTRLKRLKIEAAVVARLSGVLLLSGALGVDVARGETCTTQSQMKPAERDAIARTAQELAGKVATNDAAGLRTRTIPEYTKDFSGMASLIGSTSPKVKGAPLSVDQVYLLDASSLKTLGDGTNQDAQFFCSLNQSIAEANFMIPSLPPGRYGFAIVTASTPKAPWRMSFLVRQDAEATAGDAGGHWSMAGFYPKALTAAGRDGIWYWTQARDLVKQKQLWTAYLYYSQAQTLLQPVGFLTSTHLDKLRKEAVASAPPALSEGISGDAPLVVKGQHGADYRFTELTTDDSLGADKIDIVVHLQAEPATEPPSPSDAKANKAAKADTKSDTGKGDAEKAAPSAAVSPGDRNNNAMAALLAAYPELRTNFHGVWVFAETPGKSPFVTEQPMANIH